MATHVLRHLHMQYSSNNWEQAGNSNSKCWWHS